MYVDGAKLRQARERKVLTMRELGKLADVGHITIWRLENGAVAGPSRPSTIRALGEALGMDPWELIDHDASARDKGAAQGKAAA